MRTKNDVAVKVRSHSLASAPRRWAVFALAALLAAFLAACGGPSGPGGGGGGGGVGFVPVADQLIWQGMELDMILEISVRPNASQYTVTVKSDNPVLVPSSAIELRGLGADWFLTITPPPEQTGTALITAELRRVSAPSNVIATESFRLTVNAVSRTLPQHELIPTGLTERADLGAAVALDGDTLVVGANEEGAAYVFTRSGTEWVQTARLSSDDAGSTSFPFGASVAISGDTIIVGSRFTNTDAGSTAGAAYVFTRSGGVWNQTAKVLPEDPSQQDYFGQAVALTGPTLVVGAPGARVDGTSTGAAYAFTDSEGSWSQTAKLAPSDLVEWDDFGTDVAISGDTLVVVAPKTRSSETMRGAAYVFVLGGAGWSEQTTLEGHDAMPWFTFGRAVAIDGNTVVVGAPNAQQGSVIRAGTAYVFTRSGTTWSQADKLESVAAQTDAYLGSAVAVAGGTIVLGAPGIEVDEVRTGAVYVYSD